MCFLLVVTGGMRVTGGAPVGSLGLSKRFIAIVTGLTGVIGRFETARPVLQR